MNVTTTTLSVNAQHLASMRALESVIAGRLSKSNAAPAGSGATNYGKVVNGTVLSKDTNGVLHPCGCIELADTVSAGNEIPVEDARGFFVGDIASVVALQNIAVVIAAGDDPSNLTVTARKSGVSVDLVAGATPLAAATHSYDAATGRITVNLAQSTKTTELVAAAASGVTVTPRYKAFSVEIVVSGTSTAFSYSYDAATDALTVNSATDGGGLATTTTGDLAALLEGEFGALVVSAVAGTPAAVLATMAATNVLWSGDAITTTTGEVAGILEGTYGEFVASAVAETPADLAVDVGPTSLFGAYQVLASARNVTAVDLDTDTVTISGAAIDASTACVLVKDGAYKPRGVLDGTKSTVRYVDLTEVAENKLCDVRYEGDLRTSQVVGAGAFLRRCMAGDAYPDVLNGGVEIAPEHAGFVFRSI